MLGTSLAENIWMRQENIWKLCSHLAGKVHLDRADVAQDGSPDVGRGEAERDLVPGELVLLGQVLGGFLGYQRDPRNILGHNLCLGRSCHKPLGSARHLSGAAPVYFFLQLLEPLVYRVLRLGHEAVHVSEAHLGQQDVGAVEGLGVVQLHHVVDVGGTFY